MKLISTALLAAKRNFTPALKDKINPAFKGQNVKYADLAACLHAVDDACLDAGIVLYQETSEDPRGVTVETVFLHESGETLRCGKLHVPASKNDAQGFGSALTYARRYSLLTACGIASEDDDGNAATKTKPSIVIPAPPSIESLGINSNRQHVIDDVAEAIKDRFASTDLIGAYEEYLGITDNDEKTALWQALPSHIRSAIKKHGESLKQKEAA